MNEKIIETISKLIQARDKAVNEHEAANAAGIINRLLLRHNISEADVQISSVDNSLVSEAVDFVGIRTISWHAQLCGIIARAHLCSHLRMPTEKKFKFFGRKQNVDVAVYMFKYLRDTIIRIAKEQQLHKRMLGEIHGKSWWNDWYHGCIQEIDLRLSESRKETVANSTNTELILRNKAKEAQDYRNSLYRVVMGRIGGHKGSGGFGEGRNAGRSINLTRGSITRQRGLPYRP